MNNQRVKAFTIMEVTIVMLIAAIVIGMAYSVYAIVTKSYSSFNVKNKDMAVVLRLDELIKRDFEHAAIITKSQDGVSFKSPDQLINYEITDSSIVRTGIAIDTFKVQTQALTTSFEGQPITELSEHEESNRIDDVTLNLLFENEKIPYHYHKVYSSANLMQRKANAVN